MKVKELRKFDPNQNVMVYTMHTKDLVGYTTQFSVMQDHVAGTANLDGDMDIDSPDVEAVLIH